MPPCNIQAANRAVKRILDDDKSVSSGSSRDRGQYEVFSPDEKAIITKCAVDIGVTKAIRKLEKKYPGKQLKESTIRTWVKKYRMELKRRGPTELEDRVLSSLENDKRGRPLLLGKEMDDQVEAYILALRDKGGVINSAIVKSCATGIVEKKDMRLLKCNGGHIDITKYWALSFLERLGFVKRRANTKAKISVEHFEELKAQFLYDINVIVEMADIPADLIINWDHTGINYWTMAPEGSTRVEITGVDDKRQITVVFAGTMSGFFLPPQVIYKGTTRKCCPSVTFPDSWHITYTANHWATAETTQAYIERILLPYVTKKREELGVKSALIVFDRFKGQCTPPMLQLLASNSIYVIIVPGNCTDRLQLLDISVNKSVKEMLRGKFQSWYAKQMMESDNTVDLKMSVMKPLGAKWLMEVYYEMLAKPEIIINGFKGVGIVASS